MDSKILKMVLLVLAIITMGVGLYAHYSATWVKEIDLKLSKVKPYEMCKEWPSDATLKCPKISMERYFVAMVIICLLWSIASLALAFLGKDRDGAIKFADMGLHIIFGVLLLIGAIVFFVSASQIRKLYGDGDINSLLPKDFQFHQRYGAKIAAGVLAILQTIVHIGVAALAFKG